MSDVDELAQVIWDYHQMHHEIKPADAIFVLCSYDPRVAERAAELYLTGYAPLVIFSGGNTRHTQHFAKSEAEIFADIAIYKGVPEKAILVETQSANTEQNIVFTYKLLREQNIRLKSLILVQKPYMQRRTYATFMQQWPGESTAISVTSPQISYRDYIAGDAPKDVILNHMVGDLLRIKVYPKLGYQIEQHIPEQVWQAARELVLMGYDKHMLAPKDVVTLASLL